MSGFAYEIANFIEYFNWNALSAFFAGIGLFFIAWQIRKQTKSEDLKVTFELCEKINDHFQRWVESATTNYRAEFVNLLSVFESISYAVNHKLVSKRSRYLACEQMTDLLEKIGGSEEALTILGDIRKPGRELEELAKFVKNNCKKRQSDEFAKIRAKLEV